MPQRWRPLSSSQAHTGLLGLRACQRLLTMCRLYSCATVRRCRCLQRNMIREATAFLLDALAADRPEQAALQTKLLEINLITNPQASWFFIWGRGKGECH
jgi:hypothetical protein